MIADTKNAAAKVAELLRRAQDDRLTPKEARAVGAALADLYMRSGQVKDAPLAEFTMDAYVGFDARVSAVQAKAGLRR